VHRLQDGQSRHQPCRQRRPARVVVIDLAKPLFEKAPVDRRRQLHHVEDLIEPRPQQVALAAVSSSLVRIACSLASNQPNHAYRHDYILQEIALQGHDFRQTQTQNRGKS
jgi:hypothetical protein